MTVETRNGDEQYDQMPPAIQLLYSMPVIGMVLLALFTTILGIATWGDLGSLAEARGMGPTEHSIVLNQELATQAYFGSSTI